jgi:hypothetical protein
MQVPPPPNDKPVVVYDTECYRNFWLLKWRYRNGVTQAIRLYDAQRLSTVDVDRIVRTFESVTAVSFNGIYYDVPMIAAALQGYTPAELKMINNKIIVDKVKPWELNIPEWKPVDHIDIMEVAPGMGGQKQYAGRIHSKKMQDLPYDPEATLTLEQIEKLDEYNDNDLDVLEELYEALIPQIQQREALGKRYGLDLRSKSDAQVAEAVLKSRCEQATGRKLYKPDINWNLAFKYNPPQYIDFTLPQLRRAFALAKSATFKLGAAGAVEMPPELKDLEIVIGEASYTIGIGGLHSSEKRAVHIEDEVHILRDIDVEAYYPNLMLKAGAYPPALGEAFLREFESIKNERVAAKALQGKLKKAGDTSSPQYIEARVGNEGGKIMINGTLGKTGSPYSILFAPEMLIQTTLTGQLLLLMLIEWHEAYGIRIVSANTDGIVMKCPLDKLYISEALVAEWEKRTGLKMEETRYLAVYSRDVNNYFAVKMDGEVKRKGEYAPAGLTEKKNPDVEICSDAVAEFLSKGTPLAQTIFSCTDIRKFVTIQKVNGGGVKMWGEGPDKNALVRDMVPVLERNGWYKDGRKWRKGTAVLAPREAYETCFAPQTPEYLGKVVRWYYGTRSPGPIVYASNGNTVSLSYGARPCMTLPDEFPDDINYDWYIHKADDILKDIGFYNGIQS